MHRMLALVTAVVGVVGYGAAAQAAEVKILTAGAMKAVVLAIVPEFEKQTGHKAIIITGATGKFYAQIVNGAPFDSDRCRNLELHPLSMRKR